MAQTSQQSENLRNVSRNASYGRLSENSDLASFSAIYAHPRELGTDSRFPTFRVEPSNHPGSQQERP
ncbi:MAG: hypothetical protein DYG85_11185 [Chloroflexi bacterium CFX1]|nr:hypothetical protein [Chloroflexi bacterium CFX1]MCQ3953720.1 hypothetical protein [Chloroflexota bacterium]